MLRPLAVVAAVAVGLGTLSVPRTAHALGPVDVEVGAIAGAGTTPSNTPSGSPNTLGFGLGGRGGVSLAGFYGGVEGMYYFGGGRLENSFSGHSATYGVDVGYGIKLSILTIRPLLGIGNYVQTVNGSAVTVGGTGGLGGPVSDTSSTLYVQPGVTGLISLGALYVGADASVLLLTSMPQSTGGSGLGASVTIHGQVGVRF